jgi:Fe-S-cluster containining protein
MTATGRPAAEIVEFYDSTEITTSQRDRGWIEMRAGRRIMGLRKKRGGCQFLKEDQCTIYEHRPVTCRRYPFNLVLDEQGKIQELSIHRAVKCLYELDGRQSRRELKQTSDWEDRQDATYYGLVKEWNRSKARGTKLAYLRFLGLVEA